MRQLSAVEHCHGDARATGVIPDRRHPRTGGGLGHIPLIWQIGIVRGVAGGDHADRFHQLDTGLGSQIGHEVGRLASIQGSIQPDHVVVPARHGLGDFPVYPVGCLLGLLRGEDGIGIVGSSHHEALDRFGCRCIDRLGGIGIGRDNACAADDDGRRDASPKFLH